MTAEFAEKLKESMEAMGFTQRRLALDSGVDHSTISRLSTGNRNATAEVAAKLADSLIDLRSEKAEFLLFAAGHSEKTVKNAIGYKRKTPSRASSIK